MFHLQLLLLEAFYAKKTRDDRTWTEFYDNKLKKVLSDGDGNSIKQVLKVSYNDLHPNLKLCFAACSLFPKDYRFDKDELVRLWLAQGVLKPCDDNEQSLEEVGESYFFQLVDRCFFQEVQYRFSRAGKCEYVGSEGDKCSAKMHDLLRDIAIEVAKTENLFLDKVPEKKREIDCLRHVSIYFDILDSFDCCSVVYDPKSVRTLLLWRGKPQYRKSLVNPLLESFTRLRTLDLASVGVDDVPESIGELIHLRCLDLSSNEKLKRLPDSICKLHHLMILALKGCHLLEKLPRRIEKLASLRQLYIDGCNRLDCLPPGLERLTRLVNLDRLIVHHRDGGLRYLEGLDNLAGVLKIELPEEGWFEAVEDAKKSNMARKNKLNEMRIEWKQSSAVTVKMGKEEAEAVLEALRPHEKLEYLRIDNYSGEMLSSWFWSIKYVKQLHLYKCDNVKYLEDGIKGDLGLPSLKLLRIEEMRNLKGWWWPETAQGTDLPHLSSVSSLSIEVCPELKGKMPVFEGIEYLQLTEVDAELLIELLVPNNRLKELHLLRMEALSDLPEGLIRHLTALERLTIKECWELRRLSGRGLAHLTALKELYIGSGEIGDEDEIEDDKMRIREAGMPWKALPGLESLIVEAEDMHLLDGLEYLTSLQDLRVVKWGDVARLQVELPFKALQNLSELSMGFGQETFDLPKSGIQHLHSLQNLVIANCKELYLGWKALLGMKQLWGLMFYRVERVIDIEEDMMMVMEVEPHSLLQLLAIVECAGEKWIDNIPWIFLSSSLERLDLSRMGERENLPDGIQHLSSLQTLKISGCEKVTSLPVWIPKLTSLPYLSIDNCSAELKRRCERGKGEDWPLISHLPLIDIIAARRRGN